MPLCKNYKHYYLFLLWQEEIVEVGMIKPNGALCSIFWKEIGSSDQFPHHHALPNIDFSPGSKKNTRCKQKAGDHAWHYLHYSCFAKHAALIKPILRQLEKKKKHLVSHFNYHVLSQHNFSLWSSCCMTLAPSQQVWWRTRDWSMGALFPALIH